MTLTVAIAPLAVYAMIFQTAVYLSLPERLRSIWAPVVTGVFGATLIVAAGASFGFEKIGMASTDPVVAGSWFLSAVAAASVVGAVMRSTPALRPALGDQRLAYVGRRQALTQILVRIPVFTALIEEAFFRGVLHAALTAIYPIPVALWIGAGLFGMWHIGPGLEQARRLDGSRRAQAVHIAGTVVATTVAGAFLVWLRIETGSIWAPVAAHAGVNMTLAAFSRSAGSGRSVVRAGDEGPWRRLP